MQFKKPTVIFTAESNVECHLIVEILANAGIAAHAVEDTSGASLFAFGTLSQFHQPNVYVEESDSAKAKELIQQFEASKQSRLPKNKDPDGAGATITATCEECGKESQFPESANGTTEDCPHCSAYMDVGDLGWDEDFGTSDDSTSESG